MEKINKIKREKLKERVLFFLGLVFSPLLIKVLFNIQEKRKFSISYDEDGYINKINNGEEELKFNRGRLL